MKALIHSEDFSISSLHFAIFITFSAISFRPISFNESTKLPEDFASQNRYLKTGLAKFISSTI